MRTEREYIMKVELVDINTVREFRTGYELVEFEKGTNPEDGFCILGFDEIGMFCQNPAYAWVAMTGGDHVAL